MKKWITIPAVMACTMMQTGCIDLAEETTDVTPVLPIVQDTSGGDILIDSAESFANAITFDGAIERVSGITPPAAPTGGSLSIPSELAVTAGGTSTMDVIPTIADGYQVAAYMVNFDGTDKRFIIPVDATGAIVGVTSGSLTAASDVMLAGATTTRDRTRMSCTGMPNITLTPPNTTVTSGSSYTAPATVQAYTVPVGSTMITDWSSFGPSTNPDQWTQPAPLTMRAVEVGSGVIQVTLTWDTTADVDLHVVEPGGEEIYYAHRTSSVTGAYLDVDDINGYGPENIFYETQPGAGAYDVSVKHYSGAAPTNYTVTVLNNGVSHSYSGTLGVAYERDQVTSISVQ